MKERPILFSGPMVRAILDGRKTQTRRILKPQPEGGIQFGAIATPHGVVNGKGTQLTCRFGLRGDRLWVRETWRGVVQINPPYAPLEYGVARYVPDQEHCSKVEYAATQQLDAEPWRPSIHMPRWASRITLEITGVRVERLQDVSSEDALAEGIHTIPHGMEGNFYSALRTEPHRDNWRCAADAFCELWESINGDGSWAANPWVWVIEFKRLEAA